MSFLDSVLSSIETGKPSTSRPPPPPVSSSTAKSEVRKPTTPSRDSFPEKKSTPSGTKRKAEEQLRRPPKSDNQAPGRSVPAKPAAASVASKPRPNPISNAAKSASSSSASATPKPAPVTSSKPPPPGSFADLMMKAKNLQQNAPTQVGMFKHQAVPKERLSKMERKKRAMEAQAEKDPRLAKKGGASGTAAGAKPGDGKLARKREPEGLGYKGTSRPTQAPAIPEYRGTAGLPSKRGAGGRQQSRGGRRPQANEYLGTDEEDEGDNVDDQDDYYSDASSDMEARLDDVEDEEATALKTARQEDEKELMAELAAKKEKMERKKRLASLASRAK